MNDMRAFFSSFQNFMQNPAQMMMNAGIPQQLANNPDGIIEHLMNSGKLSQTQYNQAKRMADQMRQNPLFSQIFKK